MMIITNNGWTMWEKMSISTLQAYKYTIWLLKIQLRNISASSYTVTFKEYQRSVLW